MPAKHIKVPALMQAVASCELSSPHQGVEDASIVQEGLADANSIRASCARAGSTSHSTLEVTAPADSEHLSTAQTGLEEKASAGTGSRAEMVLTASDGDAKLCTVQRNRLSARRQTGWRRKVCGCCAAPACTGASAPVR
jgi:hypothetical protein